jgi:ATP-dependent exoDNAse (exonuclease V) alpha subunit
MPKTTEIIDLDRNNLDFSNALDIIKHTNQNIYLTGKAGTGKTTFLKYTCQQVGNNKNTIIVAPTGVAAINAGGQTIHSFFQIAPSVYVPNDIRLRRKSEIGDIDKSTIYDHFKYNEDKLKIIRELQLLIIDEVSMVRCDLLDVIDRLLRVFRKRDQSFGGVQVVLIGDTFQLAPIADLGQWQILQKFYASPYFFDSNSYKKNSPIHIEFKKIYRQNEREFIDLLNRVRTSQVTDKDLINLNSKFDPIFISKGNSNYIILATHKAIVNSTNLTKLAELDTKIEIFEANVTGIFPDKSMPTDRTLQVKANAQIMFVKNDTDKRFYNGKIAKIKSIDEDKIICLFSDDTEITVEKEIWSNVKYTWNETDKKIKEEVIGTFKQYPIKLAWAITVHKSQGLTFDKVIADLGSAFTFGQVYVALSRCTSYSGLILKTKIPMEAIKTDIRVLNFAKTETPDTLIIEVLNFGKADGYYEKARHSLKEKKVTEAIDNFSKALNYRNDIDTILFKRYISVFLNHLFWVNKVAKDKIEKLLSIIEEVTNHKIKLEKENLEQLKNSEITKSKFSNKIISLDSELKIATKENEEFVIETDKQTQIISYLSKESKSLSVNVSNLEIDNTNLLKEISKLQKEKSNLSEEFNQCSTKLKEIEKQNITLFNEKSNLSKEYNKCSKRLIEFEKQNIALFEEIDRLKNLSWFEKMTGKK